MQYDFKRLAVAYESGRATGLHLGAQGYVSIDGATVLDAAFGGSRPGVPMTTDSVMLWLSASKPVAAAAVMQLQEAGLLQLDEPVATYVPEFAANGKQDVTVRHLLTHTGGFRFLDLGDRTATWSEILRRICSAPLERNWTPGTRAGYHPYASWYVLGEVVARTSGMSFSEYVRERIFQPLNMQDCWIGMPTEVYEAYGDRIGRMVNTERGDISDPASLPIHLLSTPEGATSCVPGASGHGPMRELAKFYEMLLAGGVGPNSRVLATESVTAMTRRDRTGLLDETFKHEMDWGLGVIPNNRRYGIDTVPYGYGRHASDEAFGHSGSQSSVAFADPQHGLAVAWVFNGTCGERRHQTRIRELLDALYEDLGIVRTD